MRRARQHRPYRRDLAGAGRGPGSREILFFDHHLCHAAETYWLNPYPAADVLIADGQGGAGATSLFTVDNGRFRLLDRYPHAWSLGIFYEAAAAYAGLGWDAAGKLMGLSSFGRPSGRRYLAFDDVSGAFRLDKDLCQVPPGGLPEDDLASVWLRIFEASVFPYATGAGNVFDYATFAADIQETLEEVGMALARRLRRRGGNDVLLVAGGVALNAHLNRLLALDGGYRSVCSTGAPHDGGAAIGAGLLAASLAGERIRQRSAADPPPIFLGPQPRTAQIEQALQAGGLPATCLERDELHKEVAIALNRGEIVAWFDGGIELGPRALGARSLLRRAAAAARAGQAQPDQGQGSVAACRAVAVPAGFPAPWPGAPGPRAERVHALRAQGGPGGLAGGERGRARRRDEPRAVRSGRHAISCGRSPRRRPRPACPP